MGVMMYGRNDVFMLNLEELTFLINSESNHNSLSGLDSETVNIQFRAKAIFENPGKVSYSELNK
jgi:hypothetical protein